MNSIYASLTGQAPSLWLEIAPPRGIAANSLLQKLEAIRGHADAINLADNALGKVKMSGLVFASMIKARLGMPVALNVSCRDRNRFALKSDLLGAGALGIEAVVALHGDKLPKDGSLGARPVHDVNTFGLLQIMDELNRGDTGEGKRLLKTLPNLLPGVVGNPNRQPLEPELDLLQRKAAAGAKFVVTQPVFECETAVMFAEHAHALGLRVVLGILPLKRESMADYMKSNIKDLGTAADHFARYRGLNEEDARRMSLDWNLSLMDGLASDVAGFNIMSGGGPSLAIELALEWSRHAGGTRP
ncbi:MAG TPA: methylenetetrahydrofolate reductase [Candidatus Binataceae bacterium]|nr:methylenetetrahydrofolate reductase [Candidatus Binataceae bacterium]